MIIHSDWHIHSLASYDAKLPLETIANTAHEYGFRRLGITDHANFNDVKFTQDLHHSAQIVSEFQTQEPRLVLGVELTPIELPLFRHIEATGTRDGYVAPIQDTPYGIELAQTKQQLMDLGVRYAIGAAHWRVDVPNRNLLPQDLEPNIREWHRQQMWLACDERVTILGHPWYHGKQLWYEDFSAIPLSMHHELGAALKENHKYAECNGSFFTAGHSERFRRQYAEFLRLLFEMGVPITYGSDAHNTYPPLHQATEEQLTAVGFADGDIVEVREEDLW